MEEREWLALAKEYRFERSPVIWFMMGVDQDDLIKFVNAVLGKAASVCDDESSKWKIEAMKVKESNAAE